MGNLHEAWHTLDQIQEHKCQLIPSSLPDLIQRSTYHPEFLDRGIDLFRAARRGEVTFGIGVYAALLRAMRRDGEVERPLALLSEMRSQGVSLDAMTCHYVLKGMWRGGFERALEMLTEVRLHGAVSDYIAFNKVIQVLYIFHDLVFLIFNVFLVIVLVFIFIILYSRNLQLTGTCKERCGYSKK
jgi:pentatricopeptide repeat protein